MYAILHFIKNHSVLKKMESALKLIKIEARKGGLDNRKNVRPEHAWNISRIEK